MVLTGSEREREGPTYTYLPPPPPRDGRYTKYSPPQPSQARLSSQILNEITNCELRPAAGADWLVILFN